MIYIVLRFIQYILIAIRITLFVFVILWRFFDLILPFLLKKY